MLELPFNGPDSNVGDCSDVTVVVGLVTASPPDATITTSDVTLPGWATAAASGASVKSSETANVPSPAVTLISIGANPAGGVPVNVRVAGLKVSQAGSGE